MWNNYQSARVVYLHACRGSAIVVHVANETRVRHLVGACVNRRNEHL